ncbi:MAG: Nif3-like dinuclear metal center hexameric protein [Ruminococcaceae bacterium]|nr:Nif3-like dinuclear metal center hexameric protein [Oscillospiraceae bacterium]
MTVEKLYRALEARIPRELSCDWDNDGLMCSGNTEKEVHRVLVALDITEEIVLRAVKEKYDLIVSHHPLIFRPLSAVTTEDTVAKKVIALLAAGVGAMSFHTRLDAVSGGVNDVLAQRLGLSDVVPFGNGDEAIGRIGYLETPVSLEEFAHRVKEATGASYVQISDAGRRVHRVALLGGAGGDDADAAMRAGADTYLTGELKHHQLTEGPERGMNLIMGGHFFTENPVCERLRELLLEIDPALAVTVADSNPVRFI